MFEPVSPSGTGIDVQRVDLVDVRLEVGDRRAEGARAGPPRHTSGGPSGDVRPAVGEVARPDGVGRGVDGGRWRAARPEPEAVDVDRHPPDLATERMPERVADCRIDLAGDLRDRDAVRDGQVEVDVDGRAEVDVDPGLDETEPPEKALVRTRRRTR